MTKIWCQEPKKLPKLLPFGVYGLCPTCDLALGWLCCILKLFQQFSVCCSCHRGGKMVTAADTETLEWFQYVVQLNPENKSSVASIILHNLNRFLMMDSIKHTYYDNVFKLLGIFYFSMCPSFNKDWWTNTGPVWDKYSFVCLIQIVGDSLLILYSWK